jgi:hypothetical protein
MRKWVLFLSVGAMAAAVFVYVACNNDDDGDLYSDDDCYQVAMTAEECDGACNAYFACADEAAAYELPPFQDLTECQTICDESGLFNYDCTRDFFTCFLDQPVCADALTCAAAVYASEMCTEYYGDDDSGC